MEQQVGAFGHGKAATKQICFSGRSSDRQGILQDDCNVAGGIALRFRRWPRFLACRRRARPADPLSGIGKELASGKSRAVFQRAEWPTALVPIKVVPIAGPLALEHDDA